VKVIFITDACHSGTLAGGLDGVRNIQNVLKENWVEEVKMLSCQPGELSQEGLQWGNGRGLFSYELINGLAGYADRDSNGIVTLNELDLYLNAKVPEEAKPLPQYPMVIGNKQEPLATVNKNYLDKIKATNRLYQLTMTSLKGSDEAIIKDLPDSVKLNYGLFKTYLDNGLLIDDSLTPSAYLYYSRIPETEATKSLCALMKRNLSAALMNDLNERLGLFISNKKIINSVDRLHKIMQQVVLLRSILGDEKLISLDYLDKIISTESLLFFLVGASEKSKEI